MFTKALVGVDLSPAEKPLVGCLPELARWGVEALVLAHVIRVGYIEGAGLGHEDEYRRWLERYAGPLRDRGLAVDVSVTSSLDAADELLAVAKSAGADLVVVGSRSHNFAYDLFVGNVARKVVRKSEIPVLIERIEATEAGSAETCVAVCHTKLDRVLLATDLSEHSASAEAAAAALSANAVQTDCLTVLHDEGTAGPPEHEAAMKLESIVRRIESQGGRARARIERGRPAEVIGRVAQDGYTLVIIGKHGRGRVKDAIVGSTAAKVCETAKRPVLVVPLRTA